MKLNSHTRIRTCSHFRADTGYFFIIFMYTHSYLCGRCGRTISPPSSQQFIFLWFMKCPLVAPQSIDVTSAPIAFFAVDCDAAFISSMESNAGLLHDRREVYALDYNPTLATPHCNMKYDLSYSGWYIIEYCYMIFWNGVGFFFPMSILFCFSWS